MGSTNNEVEDILKRLHISDSKIEELKTKPQVLRNIERINQSTANFTKMHYALACTAPKNADLARISGLIDRGLIQHDNMLRGVYKAMEKNLSDDEVVEFIRRNDYPREAIQKALDEKKGKAKKDILKEIKTEMPYADFKIVMEMVNGMGEPGSVPNIDGDSADASTGAIKDWLDEGEIARLHRPGENPQVSEEIRQAHLERTKGKVVTRFPPEPNGNLHIGHAKAINLNFEYAEKFGGYTYLRYDDTNPRNECEEHFESILEDIRWLGYEPYAITSSSDYFDKMVDYSFDLIRNEKAYVCHCTLDDIRNRRKQFQNERDSGNCDATILSPYRNRSVKENLAEFQKMLDGKYGEGEAVFRFKMNLESRNPLMLDLVGSRIINLSHPRKGRNFYVYPSYEFALCVSDSLEDVTHSFCSREFYTRQEPYHWLLKNLGLYEPVQWEFARLNLSNTVLSKRKLTELVKRGMSWDDPRFYTIKGMRRRGFTPTAINSFVRSVGITFSESIIDVKILENFVRDDLNKIAKRVFCVREPLKLIINNLPKKNVELPVQTGNEHKETVTVEVSKTVYIDSADFSEEPSDGFLRLTKTSPVGLINLGTVRFVEKTSDAIVVQLVDEKPSKHIHWVPNLSHKVELRLYRPLFNSFNPEEKGYLEDINFESLEIVDGYCDSRILGSKNLDKIQFVRFGYFCCDKDSRDDHLVFNLTLPLKSSI
ncbi:glutamine-tRNA ligase [Vittaforma corneae ATCC 50505]|uniref:glutamine--tRNA ligase n=1 Tax=Vittaforma corneae (strain ATCC 50505) TaxID=993615 RepID=L2GKH3_VITCO|nr:glutamine-tRNA ligase [Vittaforma corneae ATCC 50505]ELA41010.1 glutamine-tRNA ligase [Vittaforma corneae ATCC 50505]